MKEDVDKEINERQDGLLKTAKLVAQKEDDKKKGRAGSDEFVE